MEVFGEIQFSAIQMVPIVDFLSEQGLHGFYGGGMCIIDNADEAPFNVRECTFTVDNKNVMITD